MMALLLAILWIIVFRTPAQAQEIIITKSLPHVTFKDSNEAAAGQWKLSARGEVERGYSVQNDVAQADIDEEVKVRRLGADVRSATSQDFEKYDLDSRRGLVIVWLDPYGTLASVGFEMNDMILEINGKPIVELGEFVDQIRALRPKQRIILLGLDHRSGRTGYVQVKIH